MEYEDKSEVRLDPRELKPGFYEIGFDNYRVRVNDNLTLDMINVKFGRTLKCRRIGSDRWNNTGWGLNLGKKNAVKVLTYSKVLFCLRYGISDYRLVTGNWLQTKDGEILKEHKRSPKYSTIKDIGEIEKTIAMVKQVQSGDYDGFFRFVGENCNKACAILSTNGFSYREMEPLIPDANYEMLSQMLQLNITSLPKLFTWYCKVLKKLTLQRRMKLKHRAPCEYLPDL